MCGLAGRYCHLADLSTSMGKEIRGCSHAVAECVWQMPRAVVGRNCHLAELSMRTGTEGRGCRSVAEHAWVSTEGCFWKVVPHVQASTKGCCWRAFDKHRQRGQKS